MMFMNYRINRWLPIDVSLSIENKRVGHSLPPLPIVLQDFYDNCTRVSRKPRFRAILGVFLFRGFRHRQRFKRATALQSTGCFAVTTDFILAVRKRPHEEECDRCLRCILSPLGMFPSIKFLFLFTTKECFYQSILCPKIERRRNNLNKENFQKLLICKHQR